MENYSDILKTPEQQKYLKKVKEFAKEEADIWLSTPNKSFNNKCPLDLLLSGNYDYFDRFFGVDS